ncbi:MAG TPA: glycine zipper 2TM domain-containing protein [Rhodocyclaceae bacterium]|nr:glycine zipper 2TM domain-containing protein [Rhodocyclaceae bacterium]
MENITKTTHPLILVAAASVTIASLAAAAHFTGLLPSRSNEAPVPPTAAVSAPAPAAVSAPAAVQPPPAPVVAQAEAPAREPSRPAAKPQAQRHASNVGAPDRRNDEGPRVAGTTHRVSTNNAGIDVIPSSQAPVAAAQPPAPAPAVAPPVCHECGTVENVREVVAKGEGSPVGAIAGGVLGGLLGHQVGRGSGKDLATIAGAVGGAFAGHEVEKNVRTTKQYQVEVRFDDGAVRSFTLPSATWRNGDRVRLANGGLQPIGYSDR